MKKREATSKRVASIAGKILKRLEAECKGAVWADHVPSGWIMLRLCTVSELKALCASALTQREGEK